MDANHPFLTQESDGGRSFLDIAIPLVEHKRLLLFAPLVAGLLALGIAFAIPPTFTARIVFLPPQQTQGISSTALASLGALSSLAGAATGMKNPAEQYVALMKSVTVQDRIIEQFGLMKVYESRYRFQARRELSERVTIAVGRKDGLITVDVDDEDPQRAAAIANSFVEELRALSAHLALTESQQRRAFFEGQLQRTRDRLTQAQQALQASGFTAGALKAEPKAAAEGYATLRAEITGSEVRLQALRRSLTDNAPEVQQQLAGLSRLRGELNRLEVTASGSSGPDYVGKYREFKYQEALFDLFARQYELARVDESREGALIQVVDPATPPEYKSRPKRLAIAALAMLTTFIVAAFTIVARRLWQEATNRPENADKVGRLRAALSGRRAAVPSERTLP
jgi:uncharacterized protein involved in exopolysaccharide biosynthesis